MYKKILILFSLIFLALLLGACSQKNLNNFSQVKNLEDLENVDKVELYYFHGNFRCMACVYLQNYTEETIDKYFQEKKENNRLEFIKINVDLNKNQEIVNEFQARGSSLFIKAYYNENFVIEEDVQVWRYLNNEKEFKNYLKNKLENLLNN